MNRREFLTFTGAAAAFVGPAVRAADPEGKPWPTEPPVVGRSSVTKPWSEVGPRRVKAASAKEFRAIQVTDLHQFYQKPEDDDHTFADIRAYVDRWKPDLLVATGDLWHDNPDGRGARGVDRIVREFSAIGIPWMTLWGNHDRHDNYQAAHDALAGGDHSVYGGAYTHGDYRVEVVAPGADAPALDLFCLNSNHEGLTPWQVNAFETLVAQTKARPASPGKAILFHHIPMEDLKSRLNAETFHGLKLEDVSSLADRGRTFPAVKASGIIKACFCGHNHVNDYFLSLQDVTLHYGRSTGHAGYGGDRLRKGAKFIEVDLPSGDVKAATVFPDGTRLA
jgi:DNA repair exonuclease SbcCD nuclease subunit